MSKLPKSVEELLSVPLKQWEQREKDRASKHIEKLKAKNSLLEHRALLARELAIDYDGFNTINGLKSLIDDMVKALNGELSFTNSKGEKINQDEVYK